MAAEEWRRKVHQREVNGRPKLLSDIQAIVHDYTNDKLHNLLRKHRNVINPENTNHGSEQREVGAAPAHLAPVMIMKLRNDVNNQSEKGKAAKKAHTRSAKEREGDPEGEQRKAQSHPC